MQEQLLYLSFPRILEQRLAAPLLHPASLWRDPALRKLHDLGALRGAIYQDEWADVPYLKPTGLLLVKADALVSDKRVKLGWPSFDGQGRYTGPWVRKQSMHKGLIGKSKTGEFKTAPTAAYPPSLCMGLAGGLFRSWWQLQCRQRAHSLLRTYGNAQVHGR